MDFVGSVFQRMETAIVKYDVQAPGSFCFWTQGTWVSLSSRMNRLARVNFSFILKWISIIDAYPIDVCVLVPTLHRVHVYIYSIYTPYMKARRDRQNRWVTAIQDKRNCGMKNYFLKEGISNLKIPNQL